MRLSKIKLAGFKSFVDPTTILFLSNLSAVVGPNGCGKSNVIDAVRWVMGESSAKHLRGGQITDVIFSGSIARKPVGQATVELLFDNAQGKLGGEYASYNEIAIKRQVTRDGQSHYFLNGLRCRRRDITDIFLGTGLGPRSYAIIEQGMISRVIEAKPEELRIFVEEAAGISKYKERRKETESRIKHTHDNLARITDLREELGNQLRHLQKQAQTAERYQILKQEERVLGAQLAAMVWKRLDTEITQHETQIRETLIQLEKEQADATTLKAEQEQARIEQTDANEKLNEVQKRYYSLGGEITKIEQAITHQQERDIQLKADKLDAEQTLNKTESQLKQDQENILVLEEKIAVLEPQLEAMQNEVALTGEIQQQAELDLEEWREKTTQLQQAALNPARMAESEKAKIAQLERQIHQTNERITRLETEQAQLQTQSDLSEIETVDEKILQLEEKQEDIIALLDACAVQKSQISGELNATKPQIKALQKDLNELEGQQSALQTLQASALGRNEESKKAWLKAHHLEEASCIAEKIQVSAGWEVALETVLEGYLEAVGVEEGKILDYTEGLEALKEGVCLVEYPKEPHALVTENTALIHYIQCESLPESIYQILVNVHVSETLEGATHLLSKLAKHQSVITPEGYWLGQNWIKVKAKPQSGEVGILHRAEKLKQLNVQIAVTVSQLEHAQIQLETFEEKLKDIELERESHQQAKNTQQQEIITLQSERRIKQNRIEQSQKRSSQIQQELLECQRLCQNAQQEVNTSRGCLQEALEKMSYYTDEQQLLAERKELLQSSLAEARSKAKDIQQQTHEVDLTLRSYCTQMDSLKVNVDRSQIQIENASTKLANIIQLLERNDEPILALKCDLEINLEKRIEVEEELSQTREEVAEIDHMLRAAEKQISEYEQKSMRLRDLLERVKMEWQALSVRRENALEKLKNTDFVLEELISGLPSDADEQIWQKELVDREQKIERLGAINLAAIEEYEAARQRKEYLDSQHDDLVEAITTLENAIKKIDKETRQRFKETFDKINTGFMQKFPILFGGGQAFLSMTGEDLLDTGVGIMARPPGKKNSSIQLLSGGEKALTAVALVFSIFELNPAPFCMLDEVDAPLDDSNVGRFCNLVKEMSKTVQFIFISHNKLAIEMAEQLQGVTMREPGVSRLVTVDMEEAKSMAEATGA